MGVSMPDDVTHAQLERQAALWRAMSAEAQARVAGLFPVGPNEFDVEELMRKQRRDLGEGRALFVKSRKTLVLRTMDWYRQFQGAALNQRDLDIWDQRSESLARASAAASPSASSD